MILDGYLKLGNFYIRETEEWQKIMCGGEVLRKGDVLTNTVKKIQDDKNQSEWAYNAFMACGDLLVWRLRWPNSMNQPEYDAKNWFRWKWSKLWYRICHQRGQHLLMLNYFGRIMSRLGASTKLKYRPQGNITRDPYIYYYCCAVFFKRIQFIEQIKPPWYLMTSLPFIRWRRRLIKDGRKEYVRQLDAYKGLATYRIFKLSNGT